MATNDLYALVRETVTALAAHYDPAMRQVRDAAGMEPQDNGTILFLAYADPRPTTSARLLQVMPYGDVEGIEARLEGAVARGFVERTPDQAYQLTDKGRQVFRRALEAAWARMAALEPIERDDLLRMADLLRRVVEASLAAPAPADKPNLAFSRSLDPGEDAPIVARLDQYLSDLIFFRDDAHPAAWRRYTVSGPTWEVFTLLWAGEPGTLDELTEGMRGRAHAPNLIPDSLQDLVARGWVARSNGVYAVTEAGRQLRQAAEDETDCLFYAPWACLSDDETDELRELLVRLRDGARSGSTGGGG